VVEQGKLAVFVRCAVDFPRVGPYRNVLKERMLETERGNLDNVKRLPPMPLSPMADPQPPPPAKADTNVVVQPAFKRIEDQDRETYKARWHVSRAVLIPFENTIQLLKFLEKGRLDFIGPSIGDKLEEKEQESEMQNTGKLCVDNHVHHRQRPVQDLGGMERRSRSGTPISNWEHSPTAQARRESPITMRVGEMWSEQVAEHSETRAISSSLPAPTPAQLGSLATPNVVNETQISAGTRHLPMARKVPRPASPEPPAAEQIGPARVLAPNSDASQSQSQRTQMLGGNVVDTTGPLPWMSMGDVARVMRLTAELRLRNH
jgi:hypothetical protein